VDVLKSVVIKKYGNAEAVWKIFNKDGVVGKKEWKRIIKKTNISMTATESKALRKLLPNKATIAEFCSFVGGFSKEPATEQSNSQTQDPGLAKLPTEVPHLPPSFKRRELAQEQLVAALLDSAGPQSTTLTAPKSRVSSQGSECTFFQCVTCVLVLI
jgi:hypothetical protein